ncbi:MAG: prolipoprotein diacylglyceryl transferase [Mangrovicoccus sp.]
MIYALPFPDLSPEIFAFELGSFRIALRWYALAYIAGLLIGLWIIKRAMRMPKLWPANTPPMTAFQVESLLTWVILGVILGGRLGFVLFYQPAYYAANPGDILKLWQGGMAFHGGLLGVIVAVALFCRTYHLSPGSVADAMALATPPGLLLGRLANFINGELWGRPSEAPWAVIFPGARAQICPPDWQGLCARHPSQLYEAALEGLVLGLALWILAFRKDWLKRPWLICGSFFLGYGLARFGVEHFRQADPQFISADNPWGHVLRFGEAGITMGQLLSLPMVAIGAAVILWAFWRPHRKAA